tara:strand:+ start:5017 stop:5346 length:330 start_codon:yes stop_codon:yes gene_type:complete
MAKTIDRGSNKGLKETILGNRLVSFWLRIRDIITICILPIPIARPSPNPAILIPEISTKTDSIEPPKVFAVADKDGKVLWPKKMQAIAIKNTIERELVKEILRASPGLP